MKQKLLNSLRLRVSLLVVLLCSLFAGQSWADTEVTITMSQQGWSNSTAIGSGTLKSAASVNSIFTYSSGTGSDGATEGPKYFTSGSNVRFYSKKNGNGQGNYMQINVPANTTITGVEITGVTDYTPDVKYNVDGGSDVAWTASDDKYSVSGISATSSFKFRNAYKSTSDNKQLRITAIKITYTTAGGGSTTSISANNVNIAYNAESGSIGYTLNNATGNVSASVTTGSDWLSLGTITASTVPFTCSANTGAARTATVTLSFTGASNKVVTVTQAAAPLTTMDEIFTASATAGTYYVTLNNWVVSGVNGSQAFVTDNNGKGFIIYKSDHGFDEGDILSGTVQASLTRFNGAAEFTSLSTSTTGLTVTSDGTVTPQVVAISDLSGVNTGAVVQVKNVTYNSSEETLNDASSNAIKPFNTLYSGTYSNGQMYNVTGVYQQYNTTKEILPRSAADIVEVNDPALTASLTTAVPNYVQGTPEANITLGTVTVGGTFLSNDVTVALADGASSKFEIYDAANTTWASSITLSPTTGTLASTAISIRLKAGQSAGDYEDQINVTSTGATTKNVAVAASVTTIAVTYDANGADSGTVPTDASAYAYNGTVTVLDNTGSLTKAGFTFGGWNTKSDGTGTNYSADATFNITANTTLYAKWNFVVTDGIFDFVNAASAGEDYGSGVTLVTSGYTTADKTWTAGNVTMVTSKVSGNGYRWWSADGTLRFYNESKATFSVPSGYVITKIVTTGANFDKVYDSKGTLSGSTWQGAHNEVALGATNTRNIKTITVTYTTENQTFTPAKEYTTLTCAYALDFAKVSGLKAYIATEIADSKVQMTQVNKVPANTGLVLKATTPGSAVNVPVFDGKNPDVVSGNKMVGSATETTAIDENSGYILKDGVFQPASAGTLPAGKAYLAIPVGGGSGVHALTMSFDEEDGISQIENETMRNGENEKIFNLAGQRLSRMQKGINIVNGKKILVK